jgi:small subunit ribosomal protein S17
MAENPGSAPGASQSSATAVKTQRLTKVGRVTSDKMNKTVVVSVDYARRHPLYNKVMKRTSKFKAHDEKNECRTGDLVLIEESRPISKDKRWIVREIIERVDTPDRLAGGAA